MRMFQRSFYSMKDILIYEENGGLKIILSNAAQIFNPRTKRGGLNNLKSVFMLCLDMENIHLSGRSLKFS